MRLRRRRSAAERAIERVENDEPIGDELMGDLFVELATATGARHGIRRRRGESFEHYYGRLREAFGPGSWEHL